MTRYAPKGLYLDASPFDAIAVTIEDARSVHTLRKIAPTIIALTLLTAAADVSIFHLHRADRAKYLQVVAVIPFRFFELVIALISGLALLVLLIILLRLAYSVASFVGYLWTAPQSYDGLELKDRIKLENDLRANRR
jgi:hypothetical protein